MKTHDFKSVREMLTTLQTDLIEAKERIAERNKEIDKDLQDCERALTALETPTPEDLTNLHSFQHVNPEPKKKPYRIKTREEMIRDGAKEWFDGCIRQDNATPWNPQMSYMHGRELDTNETQKIKAEPQHTVKYWTIDTWMITENK